MKNQTQVERAVQDWIAEHPYATFSNVKCALSSRYDGDCLQRTMNGMRRDGRIKNVAHEYDGDLYVERTQMGNPVLRESHDYNDFTREDILRVMYDGDTYRNVAMRLHAEPSRVNITMHALAREGDLTVADECAKGRIPKWKRSVKA